MMEGAVLAPPRCRSCGGTTAVGHDRRGRHVAVCAECGARRPLEAPRQVKTVPEQPPWWIN